MPPRSQPSAGRRRRSIAVAAAISGLAIGAAGVGTALPAVADPSGGNGGSGGAGATTRSGPDRRTPVTLITGDRVT